MKLDEPLDQKTCAEHGERRVIGYDWQETLVVKDSPLPGDADTPKNVCGCAGGSAWQHYRAADFMSLVSSAHRNDIFLSVKDVLDRLLAGETNYDDLRPDVWKQSHPEAIRIYRVEERQARADAKTIKWARRREASRLPIKS